MGECTDSEMDQYRTASAPLYANEDELDAQALSSAKKKNVHARVDSGKTTQHKRKDKGVNHAYWQDGPVSAAPTIGHYQPLAFIQRRDSSLPITAPSLYQYCNDGKPFELLIISVGKWNVPKKPIAHCGIMACRTIGSGKWSNFRLENASEVHTLK